MNYEVHNMANSDGTTKEYVIAYIDDTTAKSFPVDDTNPDYIAFIEANPDALMKKEVTE